MSKKPYDEFKEILRTEIFTTRPDSPCGHCGGYHLRACPRVRRQVWAVQGPGAGELAEVEYFEKWDDSEVIFPEDVFDDEDEEALCLQFPPKYGKKTADRTLVPLTGGLFYLRGGTCSGQ